MPDAAVIALALVFAYLSGSVPFGWLAARARGVDLRAVGSGNIGAANVTRALGRRIGFLVLAADAAKGALPVLAFRHVAALEAAVARVPSGHGAWLAGAAGFVAVVGHSYPAWLAFRGGKGVATALGVLAVLDPLALAAGLVAFSLAFAAKRYVSVASLVGALVVPLAELALARPWPELAPTLALVLLIVFRHKDNLARLREGREHRL